MTKEEYLALAIQKFEELQNLKNKKTFYEYEQTFDEIWTDLGRQVLEKNLSDIPADRRKKKDNNQIWKDSSGPPPSGL